uniref:NAD(P)H oxidase (H2O2-forming) n=1 Tax=Leptobrachium leishanense TaxID=445787 RepID=A0A8C5P9H6_9ANUR
MDWKLLVCLTFLLNVWGAQTNVDWEVQRYDGWYNNLAHHSTGTKDSKFLRLNPASYSDGVYEVAKEPELPNPRIISDVVMKGQSGLASPRNLTVLGVFFGYHLLSEIVSTEHCACPAEFLNIYIPGGDKVFDPTNKSNVVLPYQRSKWSPGTGRSPNNPRDQVNSVTTWIDGSSIYGSSHSWCDALRSFSGGQLASGADKQFPSNAKSSLPMWKAPDPSTGQRGNEGIYGFGNAMANESPFLQAASIVWFRYHNYLAQTFMERNPDWTDEDVFQNARKWVIATYQTDPSVSSEFRAITSQVLYSMMPSGNPNLQNGADVDELILGMASQIAEKEDNIVVEDLRDYWYGKMQYSRTDLSAFSIQGGRDFGLSSFNKVKKSSGYTPLQGWQDIQNSEIRENLSSLYNNDIDKLELIPGAMLEINGGLGEFVTNLILEQFIQIRDGDRFWFENNKNGLFNQTEIDQIRNTKFHHVLLAVINATDKDIQDSIFQWKAGDPCSQPSQLRSDELEKCVPLTVANYFEGSAAGFGIAITALCLLPLVSLLLAYGIAKSQEKAFNRFQKKIHSTGINEAKGGEVTEWCGDGEPNQQVLIKFLPNRTITVSDTRQTKTRTINLQNQQKVNVVLSNSDGDRALCLKIPKEYDLVLFFDNQGERTSFVHKFNELFNGSGVTPSLLELNEKSLLKESFSKKQRREMLETFFRHSMSHVIAIQRADAGELQQRSVRDALKSEISREELAELLGLDQRASFVDSLFSLADKDKNGYLSFKELCFILAKLFKGKADEKLQFLFAMHDSNGNGTLTKEEFSRMLRSFSEISHYLSPDQTEKVIESMLNEAGFSSRQEITWDEFYSLFKDHTSRLRYTDVCHSQINEFFICYEYLHINFYCRTNYNVNQRQIYTEARREKYERNKLRQKIQQLKRWVENYRRHIVCLTIFYGISAGLFAERGYYYGFASPPTGISQSTYVGLIVSRGSAACVSFMFSYMLLTMCRNLITFLRETFLNRYIPFDAAVDFHRWIAMSALILSILHTLGHLVNVYIFSITPLSILGCVFPTVFTDDGSEYPQRYYWWFFETIPGMTGVLLLLVLALMYIFACYHFRRVSFRWFWITHHLYVIFYVLTIIHGSFALIQQPRFHIYFIVPAIIYVGDKLVSLSRKKVEIEVLKAERLPSGVTHLKFQRPSDFDYKSGQWVRIACLSLGTDEYHPFTLTSAPHETSLSLHIRAVGPWTTRLRETYNNSNSPKLYLDGPFGEGHQEWNRFEVSVLVGGGIGVTPFASILKDLVFRSSINASIQCKKVYFIWVTRTQKQFEWLTDIIRKVEEKDTNDLLSVHIYITQLAEKYDFRTTMLYICERNFQRVQNRSLLTGLRSVTHFGRPPFVDFFKSLQDVHPTAKKIGVFSCGPPGMTKNVETACRKLNKKDESYFVHHYENF